MRAKPNFLIVDYGVGNLYSLRRAFQFLNASVDITEEPAALRKADAVILPGVGTFRAGVSGLTKRGLAEAVREFATSGKPMLGICLGAQLMLSRGFEFGEHDGLNLIPGKVTILERLPDGGKIPHIGWNSVYSSRTPWENTIFDSLPNKFSVYFVHSYILEPDSPDHVLGLSSYGGLEFCSAVRKNNIYGCQFHPEKSGDVGEKILGNFLKL